MPRQPKEWITIHSLDEIPVFSSEAEESEWWDHHALGEEILEQMEPPAEGELPPPRAQTLVRSRSVSVRFDDTTLRRIKALAAKRHIGYQTLLKEFVIERLYEEEKRDGLIGR